MTYTSVGIVLLALTLSSVACEPIAVPADEGSNSVSARAEPGDRVPEFLLTDSAGNAVTPATLLGNVTTLTFVVPGAAQPDSFLRRIDDVYDRLGADGIGVTRYLVTLPTRGSESTIVTRAGWLSLRGNPEAIADLAARFGVMTWLGTDGTPEQTLGVAIIGPGGMVAARFAGLETWEEMDLLIAIVEAGR